VLEKISKKRRLFTVIPWDYTNEPQGPSRAAEERKSKKKMGSRAWPAKYRKSIYQKRKNREQKIEMYVA